MAKRKSVKVPDMIVTARVKDYLHDHGFRADGELTKALNDVIADKLLEAMDRAETNGRGTVRPGDL